MIRDVVKIDEALCNGCGLCVPGCHEGALQVIDGKARLISDLMCDGLGACIGQCPQNAITIEKREAEAYNETSVMEIMAGKGKNTVIAHLKHLKDHNETEFLREGVKYLRAHETELQFDLQEVINAVHQYHVSANEQTYHENEEAGCNGGCPGSRSKVINQKATLQPPASNSFNGALTLEMPLVQSELRQWPVQLHLVNPQASWFRGADLLVAADCSAYAAGNFHQNYLKGKSLVIACPKLDSNTEVYINKITGMIDHGGINTITVLIMEVPCCGGLLQMVKMAVSAARRKVPVKLMVMSVEGEMLKEEWQAT